MRLKKARVIGFQSFADTGDIEFEEGFNLIVGQNNSGKSALLKALGVHLPDNRHRTPIAFELVQLPIPEAHFEIWTSGQEIKSALYRAGQITLDLPEGPNWQQTDIEQYGDTLFCTAKIRSSVKRWLNSGFTSTYFYNSQTDRTHNRQQCVLIPTPGNVTISTTYSGSENSGNLIYQAWVMNMFTFNAERMVVGECPQGFADRLSPSASNLPQVLHYLDGGYGDVFDRLVEHLREIFSTVGNITVITPQSPGNTFQVRVWPTEEKLRPELSFPLNESGTGIAQVLSILTAIMTLENAVIIIDEINSFLHPSAVKALIKIIQENYSHHQYIISTHALEMLSYCEPSTIHLVRREGYVSSIKRLDTEDTKSLLEVADEVGFSMSDVMGANRIIWVEGDTEELCFEHIYNIGTGQRLPRGTKIKGVLNTGHFDKKNKNQSVIFDLYIKMSEGVTSVLTNVLFSLDREMRSDADIEKMTAGSDGKILFLPRRHFECYLINPNAIAAYIRDRDKEPEGEVTTEIVAQKLAELATTRFKIDEWKNELSDPEWQKKVDAAKLINATCNALTSSRVTFTKKKDAFYLLQHILENDRDPLGELIEYVRKLVNTVSDNSGKPKS